VQATLTLPQLQARAEGGQPAAWAMRETTAKVDGRLADARIELRGRGQAGTREATLDLTGRGGRRGTAWQGQLATLEAAVRDAALGPRPWRLQLRRPFELRWAAGELDTGAGEAALIAPVPQGQPSQAQIAWDPVRWHDGQLRTAGRITGLPMAWVELLGNSQLAGAAVAGDLVFDAQWDAQLADTLRLRASLARSRGDVSVLAETGTGQSTRVQAGVREARLALESEGESVALSLRWDSERAGSAEGRVTTRLAREGGGWTWPEDAPLAGRVRAQLPRLGVWSLLAPPGWRLRGSLAADVGVAGTRADPALSGTLAADDLALRSVVDGVALQDGRLRARLEGRRLLIDEFVLHGAGTGGGTLRATGEGGWQQGGVQVRATAQLDQLRASARSDRELTLSGQLVARVDGKAAEVRGALRVDRARIRLPDESAPRLGEDVVVRNLPPGASLGRQPEREGTRGRAAVTLAVDLDLGQDFRVEGRGIATRLAGTLAVTTGETITEPRLVGQIRTIGGQYRAYSQNLEIERGVLRFTGPVDNPALEILAIRPRLTQRVGVLVAGTAQAPFVRLYAEPDLPESEKLSWLVLGRSAASGGAEAALLQQAALALVESRRGGTTGRGPAALLGLDELGFNRNGAEGPAVTLGKRLGQNLYASYERSLSGALGTLFVFYDLSRRMTVRAQAGERSAVDLIFTFSYD
jgi:translocation and assembly module TamB